MVFAKKLLRPFVRAPIADLFERQRVYNLIIADAVRAVEDDLAAHREAVETRVSQAYEDVTRYNDALFHRLDLQNEATRARSDRLLAAWDRAQDPARPVAPPRLDELDYLAFEDRHRGDSLDIRQRVERYLNDLATLPGPILDLGCGRGEALALFRDYGLPASGIDGSRVMVEQCVTQGLRADVDDVVAALRRAPDDSLGAVVSFHVIEHLPWDAVAAIVRQSWRVLRPGGLLLLETPNALSLLAAARDFWLDPTHRAPVHPDRLRSACLEAGFREIEIRTQSPYPLAQALPSMPLDGLNPEQAKIADALNRMADRLNAVLWGDRDVVVLARKSPAT